MEKKPKLPQPIDRKIYKTGQTRGADDDVIYQNRVARSSTVLIPYRLWDQVAAPPPGDSGFENGFIALIEPQEYFDKRETKAEMAARSLEVGANALVFYQTRQDWESYPTEKLGWSPANSRRAPLGGQFVARVAGTTALHENQRINLGFTSTRGKGAGIRLYEYASSTTINQCRIQLEGLFWSCQDTVESAIEHGMSRHDAELRKRLTLIDAERQELWSTDRLKQRRLLDDHGFTMCPLCLERISALGFFNRLAQAMGREVHDLTVTELNLFHVEELAYGVYNHRPYNLGWGHHHCNVVARDAGIGPTLHWMEEVMERNQSFGFATDAE